MRIINTSGKRKTAVARATFRPGKGVVRINSLLLDVFSTELARMKISEPLQLLPDVLEGVDVSIKVAGGGVMGQAEAARTALARVIVKWHNDPRMKDVYHVYDRSLLVNDSRQKEILGCMLIEHGSCNRSSEVIILG